LLPDLDTHPTSIPSPCYNLDSAGSISGQHTKMQQHQLSDLDLGQSAQRVPCHIGLFNDLGIPSLAVLPQQIQSNLS
jgi:hypothetical protein